MSELLTVAIGELWDKYTILLIKKERVTDSVKLNHVTTELAFLDENMKKYTYIDSELFKDLKTTNEQLWDIEDNIRRKEFKKEFDDEFIALARSVYVINDKRGVCKQRINTVFGSSLHEVKQYIQYTSSDA